MSAMNDTLNYLLDAVLVSMVVLQLRGRTMSVRSLLLPIAIVVYFATKYLTTFPTAGNDLPTEVAGAVLGLALGLGAGLTTRVSARGDGTPIAKAGAIAATLWLLGMAGRLFFQVWVEHGGGESVVAGFSIANHITSGAVWTDCLILMAFAEVIGRTLVLAVRGTRLPGGIPFRAGSGAIMAVSER
jgi:hypothetical protein